MSLDLKNLTILIRSQDIRMVMPDRSQKEMVFQDTLFLQVDTNKTEISRRYCSVLARYLQRALIGQKKSSSRSPPTKSSKDGMENSKNSHLELKDFGLWPQSSAEKKRYTTANHENDEPDTIARRTYIFQVKCLSNDNLKGS